VQSKVQIRDVNPPGFDFRLAQAFNHFARMRRRLSGQFDGDKQTQTARHRPTLATRNEETTAS